MKLLFLISLILNYFNLYIFTPKTELGKILFTIVYHFIFFIIPYALSFDPKQFNNRYSIIFSYSFLLSTSLIVLSSWIFLLTNISIFYLKILYMLISSVPIIFLKNETFFLRLKLLLTHSKSLIVYFYLAIVIKYFFLIYSQPILMYDSANAYYPSAISFINSQSFYSDVGIQRVGVLAPPLIPFLISFSFLISKSVSFNLSINFINYLTSYIFFIGMTLLSYIADKKVKHSDGFVFILLFPILTYSALLITDIINVIYFMSFIILSYDIQKFSNINNKISSVIFIYLLICITSFTIRSTLGVIIFGLAILNILIIVITARNIILYKNISFVLILMAPVLTILSYFIFEYQTFLTYQKFGGVLGDNLTQFLISLQNRHYVINFEYYINALYILMGFPIIYFGSI